MPALSSAIWIRSRWVVQPEKTTDLRGGSAGHGAPLLVGEQLLDEGSGLGIGAGVAFVGDDFSRATPYSCLRGIPALPPAVAYVSRFSVRRFTLMIPECAVSSSETAAGLGR